MQFRHHKERHPRASAARPGDPGKNKESLFDLDVRIKSEHDISLSPGSPYLSIAPPDHGTTSGEPIAHLAGAPAEQAPRKKIPLHFPAPQLQ